MAFPADATLFPVYGQAFEFTDVIKNSTTGNPLTGGLGTYAITLAKDGAESFSAAAGTVDEIGTTGFVKVSLTEADMTAKVIAYTITSNAANAVYATGEIKTLDLTEFSGRSDAESVKKLEHYLMDAMYVGMNQHQVNRLTGAYTLYKNDSTTAKVAGLASDSGPTGIAIRGKLS